jgi:hypothetical protein
MSLVDRTEFEAYVGLVLKRAQHAMEKHGEVAPQAQVVATCDPRGGGPLKVPKVVILSHHGGAFQNDREKAGFADAVIEIAARGAAVGVITLLEMWFVEHRLQEGEDKEQAVARVTQLPRPSESPERYEAVVAFVEHIDAPPRMLLGRILRATKRARLTGFVEIGEGGLPGVFGDVLGRARGRAT